MKNLLFLLISLFSLFLAIYFYRDFSNSQAQLQLANRRILDRDTQIYKLQKLVALSEKAGASTGNLPEIVATPSSIGQLSPAAAARLKKAGLKNPETDLKENLLANQKLIIRQKGVLGGTMAIRDIKILNEKHALAYIEDGHKGGYLVLRYELQPAGRISWVVLDSFLM